MPLSLSILMLSLYKQWSFNLTFRCIDDVQSSNNPNLADWIILMYHKAPWVKETTKATSSASFLGIYLKIWNQSSILYQTVGQKRLLQYCHYKFSTPANEAYISQLIRYARAWSLYSNILQRHRILSTKHLNQWFLRNRLILYLKNLFGIDINTKVFCQLRTDDKRWY